MASRRGVPPREPQPPPGRSPPTPPPPPAAGVVLGGLASREPPGLPLPPVRPAGRASAWVGAAFLDQLRSPAGRSTAAGDWWRFQRAPGRVRAVWSWRDPRPGLGLLALLGRGALGRHRRDGAG